MGVVAPLKPAMTISIPALEKPEQSFGSFVSFVQSRSSTIAHNRPVVSLVYAPSSFTMGLKHRHKAGKRWVLHVAKVSYENGRGNGLVAALEPLLAVLRSPLANVRTRLMVLAIPIGSVAQRCQPGASPERPKRRSGKRRLRAEASASRHSG